MDRETGSGNPSYRIFYADIHTPFRIKIIVSAMRKKLNKDDNKELYKKRVHSSEAPYGHIKHNLKYRQVMRRGTEKVKMETALLGILHNGLKFGELVLQYLLMPQCGNQDDENIQLMATLSS